MRLISNEELAHIGGADQQVIIRGTRMTDAEKAEYDAKAARIANGIDSCGQGDPVGCGVWLLELMYDMEFNFEDQQSLIDWNLVSA